jgi:hypothetical protein
MKYTVLCRSEHGRTGVEPSGRPLAPHHQERGGLRAGGIAHPREATSR